MSMRRTEAMVVGLVATAVLASCTLEPHYKRPDLPTPDQWPMPTI